MKIMMESTPEGLTIYREKWGAFFYALAIGTAAVLLGCFFSFYVAEESQLEPFVWTGYLFIILGGLVLITLPMKFHEYSKSSTGDVLVQINQDGVTLSSGLGADVHCYHWHHLKKIIFTDLYLDRDLDGEIRLRNRIIFIFHSSAVGDGLIERAKRSINLNKDGHGYFVSPFPRKLAPELVKDKFQNFCKSQCELEANQIQKME